MNIIKTRNKKGNIIIIKFNNYLIIFVIFFLLISLGESKLKLPKINFNSEILIIIRGIGKQPILNIKKSNSNKKYFNYTPSEIYINNIFQNITDNL